MKYVDILFNRFFLFYGNHSGFGKMWKQQSGQWWYCCFHALQKGDINKVVPIDKSSTVLSILLALIFLREGITGTKIVSVLLIGIEGIDSNLGTAIRTTVVLL